MYRLKRLSALKEAFPPPLFVERKGLQLLPKSSVPLGFWVRNLPGHSAAGGSP